MAGLATDPRIDKFRKQADALQKHIDHARRPMTQNATPKRIKEYNSRLHDAGNLERTQRALLALANAFENGGLSDIKLLYLKAKEDVARLVHKRIVSHSYYHVMTDPEYADKSPAGIALQTFLEVSRDTATVAKDTEQQRTEHVRQLENNLRWNDMPGFFPTPRSVIDDMLCLADVQPGHRVLEPSAGKGDILDALRECGVPDSNLYYCEIRPSLVELLRAKGYPPPLSEDFLTATQQGVFDRILMNPPFERGVDMVHVRFAYEMLREPGTEGGQDKDGGRLVSVMSAGPFFRQDRQSTEFRSWLDSVGGVATDLPEDSFQGSKAFRQTGTRCKLVLIDRQANKKPPAVSRRG